MSSWRKLFFSPPSPHHHNPDAPPPPPINTKPGWPPVPISARSWKSYGKIGDYDRSKLWQCLGTGIAVEVAVHRLVVACAYGFYMLPGGSAEFIRPNCMKLRLTRSVPFHHNSTRCKDFNPPKPRPAVSASVRVRVFNIEKISASKRLLVDIHHLNCTKVKWSLMTRGNHWLRIRVRH